MKALLGGLVVAAHAIGFVALATRCRGTELVVDVPAPPASPVLALDGTLPGALAGRIAITDSPAGPGLHRRRWSVRYRGGIERSVGAVQLVGPFQDPSAARCTGRVAVGQGLLDDGHAGPGTIALAMQAQIEAALRGEAVFPVGEFQRLEHLTVRWAQIEHHAEDRVLVGEAPHGYVRVSATVGFARVAVPMVVALIPVTSPGELRFRVAARAELLFDSRVVQWISDKLGGNALATRFARRQIDDALVTALAPPPPLALPDGQTIRFTYCDEPPEIAEGACGALPFGVAFGPSARDARILPPRLGHGPRGALPSATTLALDLDLDALNALLYELWRGGFLDRRLAEAGLDRRFNTDPTVAEFLTLRLAPLHLTLPPVVTATPGGLRLLAEARVAIHDGPSVTIGRVWGGLDFQFAARTVDQVIGDLGVDLDELELSCERTPTTLVPCYGDLVAALRDRSKDFHGALTETFVKLISDSLVGRLGATGSPVELVIRAVTPSLRTAGENATLHLELDGAVTTPQ